MMLLSKGSQDKGVGIKMPLTLLGRVTTRCTCEHNMQLRNRPGIASKDIGVSTLDVLARY